LAVRSLLGILGFVSQRIVVVEDEPAIAESVAYSLERSGFSVAMAATEAAARSLVTSADLVVLDLILPDGDGINVLRWLRQSGSHAAVIVLSSRDAESDRILALEMGADDYVTKPFSPREVVARVKAVLRRTSTSANQEVAAVHPLNVDRETRRAFVHKQGVDLTRVEFDLLATLLDVPGRVYTRAQLIDRVWGDGFALSDRTVDSHVKLLRRKIGDAGGNADWIETVRGVGYRVIDSEVTESSS
jgi:DNA-binding response OmpR family regulator